MKRVLFIGSLVGFCVSVAWGFAGIIFFGAPEGTFSRVYWILYRTTVPLNYLTPSQFFFLDPFVNAAVYAFISLSIFSLVSAAKILVRS